MGGRQSAIRDLATNQHHATTPQPEAGVRRPSDRLVGRRRTAPAVCPRSAGIRATNAESQAAASQQPAIELRLDSAEAAHPGADTSDGRASLRYEWLGLGHENGNHDRDPMERREGRRGKGRRTGVRPCAAGSGRRSRTTPHTTARGAVGRCGWLIAVRPRAGGSCRGSRTTPHATARGAVGGWGCLTAVLPRARGSGRGARTTPHATARGAVGRCGWHTGGRPPAGGSGREARTTPHATARGAGRRCGWRKIGRASCRERV